MTHETVGPSSGAQEPSTTPVAPDVRTRRAAVGHSLSAVARPLAGFVTVVGERSAGARGAARRVATRIPGTIRATRAGASEATSALQTLPDPTLRSLAASSVGLATGFYLTGARRVVVIAGVAPAVLAGAAIALRGAKPSSPPTETGATAAA
jgi:hypothetical protein